MTDLLTKAAVRVVICTYQSHRDIASAIASCLNEGLDQAQVSVVDNGSSDGTVAEVSRQFPAVQLTALGENRGFAAATNLGAKGADGGALLLLNPDAEMLPGALEKMLAALNADPVRGAVSPRVVRPDGRLDPACRRSFPSPEAAFWRLSGLSRLGRGSRRLGRYNLTHLPEDQAMAVDSGSGACLLVRRAIWDAVGGLDEGYFMYGEDLELCWQLHRRGSVVWYEPGARVLHRKGQSSEQAALPMLVHFHQSMWRFYRLHYGSGRSGLLAPLVALAIAARLLLLLALNGLRRRPRVSP